MLLFTGCKKDHTLNCISLPSTTNPTGWNYVIDSDFSESPCFDPNNANEFVFIKHFNGISALCTFNTQTNSLFQLYTGSIFGRPDWGLNDWILFNVSNDIYKIKKNGDSLTRLTTGGISIGGKWVPNQDKYTYSLFPGSGYNGIVVASSSGKVIDSFSIALGDTSVSLDTTFIVVNASNANAGFIVYGGRHQIPKLINCKIDIATYSGACYINSLEFIWADKSGLYITNIQTGQTIKIKENCNSIAYLLPNYSSLSNRVILGKTVKSFVNSSTLKVSKAIVLMNPDGTAEQEINIH